MSHAALRAQSQHGPWCITGLFFFIRAVSIFCHVSLAFFSSFLGSSFPQDSSLFCNCPWLASFLFPVLSLPAVFFSRLCFSIPHASLPLCFSLPPSFYFFLFLFLSFFSLSFLSFLVFSCVFSAFCPFFFAIFSFVSFVPRSFGLFAPLPMLLPSVAV